MVGGLSSVENRRLSACPADIENPPYYIKVFQRNWQKGLIGAGLPASHMDSQMVRLTAQKLRISQILAAPYLPASREFEPSGIKVGGGIVSRINIMGIVVAKSPGELALDDASAQVTIRLFDQAVLSKDIDVGNAVQIIGRVRDFQGSRYIVPEAIACIRPEWLEVRKKEIDNVAINAEGAALENPANRATLSQVTLQASPPQERTGQAFEKSTQPDKVSVESVLESIRLGDTGNGAIISLIIDRLGPDAEPLLERLIAQGEIFETSPGKVKVLE